MQSMDHSVFGSIELGLLGIAGAVFISCFFARLRAYRSLLLGAALLLVLTALIPQPDNLIGRYLFSSSIGKPRLPSELFGIVWWILGAWLVSSVLDLILRRTMFPDDNEPHAKRLFADLATVLVYVVAMAGIMDTVFKQPLSALLATSGVLAIVLGLALQTTLADVFSGLAINIERPFGAGDWITLNGGVEGQVIQINWRATHLKTSANEMTVIPNSVVAKATVTNHRRLNDPQIRTIDLTVDHSIAVKQVLQALETAASATIGTTPGFAPFARATGFSDGLICYRLSFGVDHFTLAQANLSVVIEQVSAEFTRLGIPIGSLAMEVRLSVPGGTAADAGSTVSTALCVSPALIAPAGKRGDPESTERTTRFLDPESSAPGTRSPQLQAAHG